MNKEDYNYYEGENRKVFLPDNVRGIIDWYNMAYF
jgi:hypothetical protein